MWSASECRCLVTVLAFGTLPAGLLGAQEGPDQPQAAVPERLRTDSRAPYVHRISLYDHDGVAIDPADEPAAPYSPMKTCGKCHEVGLIARGWHFNANQRSVDRGRPGEPWILTDAATGTQLPISGRGWPGTYAPEEVGLSDWAFVKRVGAHLPGGGYGMPDRDAREASAEALRWEISGTLEIDCMFCHSADRRHDPAEAHRQIERENFRWSATAALGLAVVRGDAKNVPDDYDSLAGPDPDRPELSGPRLEYDPSRFDADDRVFLDISRRPPVERCYFCHSFRQVGVGAADAWEVDQDVHLVAGMRCTDCHRNGIDHMITRGYADEPAAADHSDARTLTCRGCHLGEGVLSRGPDGTAGRLGAPYPLHKGMPGVHFEKLTCTTCHSGTWPEDAAKRLQTAMNHGLGLPTRERTDNDLPTILTPIFARTAGGVIAPQRMIWPSFWARLDGEQLEPLAIERVERAAGKLAARAKIAQAQGDSRLADADMRMLFAQLVSENGDAVVYVRDGLVHRLAADGGLRSEPHDAVRPYLWPLAHDVRPASQSLGIRGCTDCHADDAPIYFGRLAAADEAGAEVRPLQAMHEMRGDDTALARSWNVSFRFRTVFKWFGIVCAGLIVLVLLHFGLAGLERIGRK